MIFAQLFDPATVSMPAWAVSDEAKAWVLGFIFGALVRITKASLLHFKRAGSDMPGE